MASSNVPSTTRSREKTRENNANSPQQEVVRETDVEEERGVVDMAANENGDGDDDGGKEGNAEQEEEDCEDLAVPSHHLSAPEPVISNVESKSQKSLSQRILHFLSSKFNEVLPLELEEESKAFEVGGVDDPQSLIGV